MLSRFIFNHRQTNYWLYFCLIVLINSIPSRVLAQTTKGSIVNSTATPISQIPSTPLPQDVLPPNEPTGPVTPTPETLPPPEELLQSPPPIPATPSPIPGKVPETFTVERFDVVGSTVFSPQELDAVLAPFTKRPLTFAELFQARSAITQLYIDNGYITSGALIPPQKTLGGVVTLQIVEGSLEATNVKGTRRLNPEYVRSRLPTSIPLNRNQLLEALQLLQLNPLIEDISAELAAGTSPETSVLEVSTLR